jgi:hypothetical protein
MANIAVSVWLEGLKCNEQEDTEPPIFDTEDDEPYVLVISINGKGRRIGPGGAVQLPESRVFRIGPIEDFDKDDFKFAPPNALWGLNPPQAAIPAPAPIPDIDQVFFLVSLLENDNADPAQVENRIVAFAEAGLSGLWLDAQGRRDLDERGRFDLFVETVRRAMDGVIDLARLNPLDPDDKN